MAVDVKARFVKIRAEINFLREPVVNSDRLLGVPPIESKERFFSEACALADPLEISWPNGNRTIGQMKGSFCPLFSSSL
jgi:hypothetical protein